jgi:DNA-binding GntR family transcriptional regulator
VSSPADNGGAPGAAAQPAGAGLAEHVYLLLKAEVINDQFAAGDRIVIESVAIRLGVSPTPVREALARLAGEQLVGFRAYVGYSALPPLSVTELRDLFEAREVIECAGAVRSCKRATDADLERLREIDAHIRAGHYGKERYSEFVSFVNDNQRFHETLLDAARNPELRRAFDALNYEARIARRTRGRGIPDLGLICDEHAAIIAALAARDANALVAAVTAHARESHQRLADDLARVRAVN